MNATRLKHARSDKWASEYGGGEGFETYQVIMGIAVALIASAIFWIPFSFVGIGIGVFAGFGAAIAPNHLNTRHKHARKHLVAVVKKRLNHTLILNDKRVADPPDERETFFVEIVDFPPSTTEDSHG
jgi:hypothetical protein